MTDADERYLADIAEDCRTVLGHGIEWLELDRADLADGVRLTARHRLGDRQWGSTVTDETIVAAHGRLRARLLFDRLRLGFTALVEASRS